MAPSTPSCILCSHPDRAELDAALDQGASVSDVARRAGTSRTSVRRHRAHRATPVVPGSTVGSPAPEASVRPPAQGAPIVEGDQVHLVDRPAVSDPAGLAPKRALPSITPPTPELAAPPAEDLVAFVQQLGEGFKTADKLKAGPGKGHRCACCASPRRAEIDRLLHEGVGYTAIEAVVAPGPAHDSIRRHAQNCIPAQIARTKGEQSGAFTASVQAHTERLLLGAQELLEQGRRLVEEAQGDGALCAVCQAATGAASPRDRAATVTAARGIFQAMTQQLELLAKLRGELRTDVDVRVILGSPVFAQVMEVIRTELRRHPEARADVAAALERLEARQGPRLVSGS